MAAREIVISLRLSEGTTREQFRALKAALIDVKTEIGANNRALKENKVQQDQVSASIKAGTQNIQAQEAQLRVLEEREKALKNTAADLALSELALSKQYSTVKREALATAEAMDKLREAQIQSAGAAVKQRDAIGAATEKAKQLSTVAKQLFAEFKKGERTDEQFHKLNAAINDTRTELTANKRALEQNAKAERELAQEIRLSGVATEEQTNELQRLATERAELQAVNSSLKISEGTLSAALREVGNDVKGLTEASLRFRDKMAQASKEALEQSGILGQLGARMEFLRAEQDRLNKELLEGKGDSEQLRASLDKLGNEEKELVAQTTALNGKVDRLTQEFKEGKIGVEQYKAQMASLNTSVQGVGTAVSKGVADLKSYALGFVGVVAVAQGAINVIKSVGKTITGFQQANTNLAAILGTTRDKITELTDSAIKIGPAFGRAPEEVTQLQTELAKLGFTIPEVIAAQEAIITLANATGETLAKSAEVAAATLNGFNLEATETGRIVDVIAEAANRSSLDLEKFSVAMATVAPAANQAGFSIEQTTALIGILSDRGLDASTAGTALRSIFIDLAKTGQTFEQAMAEINASTNKTGTAFKLFGERAAGSAVILAEAGAETDRLTEALNNAGGAAEKVANEQLDTLSGSISKLSASWDAFVLSIDKGDGIISRGLKSATGALTQFLNILSGNDEFSNFQKDLDAIAKSGGLGTSGLGDTEPVKKAREEVGAFLSQFNAIGTNTKLSAKEAKDEFEGLALFIRDKIAEVEKAEMNGLIDPDIAKGQVGALLTLIEDRINPAIEKQVQLQNESAQASQKVTSATQKEAGAIETLAEKRARLNEELASEKAFQGTLAATDTAAIARSEERVKGLQKQLSAVDSGTKATKEQSEAEKEKIEVTKALTKAEEDRTRAQQIAAQTKVQQQADPTISAPQAQAEAVAIVDSSERLAKIKGDAELEKRIAEQLAKDLLSIREKFAVEQVSVQDKANADLRSRNAALAQNELDALIERQNAELFLAAQNGEDINALAQKQAEERIALTQVIEDAAIAAKLESFDAEYALAETNGTDLLALTQTQQEELAALKASFRQDELSKQIDASVQLKNAETDVMQARIASFDALGQAVAASAKEGSKAAKIGLALQKAAAIAQILINLQLEKSAIDANPAYNLLPDNGQLIKNTLKAFATIRAGFNIATVAAQAIQGFDKGGEVGGGNGTIKRSWGKPIRRKNGDNVLITARAGEKILNEEQQEELERQHGRDVWKRIGLPGTHSHRSAQEIIQGFASGGTVRGIAMVNAADLSGIENSIDIRNSIENVEFMVSVQEINRVQQRVAQVTELSRA